MSKLDDFIFLDEVDSTSSEASRLLDSHKVPFAVAAAHQISGRGQRGNVWKSAGANIYLSIAVDPKDLKDFPITMLPLRVAFLLSQWIADKFSLGVTIKWPNDLYLAGQKIGGILCESSVQGNSLLSATVGIGLNLNGAPEDENATFVGKYFDLNATGYTQRELSEDLYRWFLKEIKCEFDFSKFSTNYLQRSFSLGSGALISGIPSRFAGIDETGSILVDRILGSPTQDNLTHTDLSWEILAQPGDKIFVADIGNTKIKLARLGFVKRASPVVELSSSVSTAQEAQQFLEEITKNVCPTIYAISVNTEKFTELRNVCEKMGIALCLARKRQKLSCGGYNIQNIGLDRLAAAEAWIADCYINNRPAPACTILVGCGTAMTIDVIQSARSHLGGWIVPGLQTALNSLSANTSSLPRLEVKNLTKSQKSIPLDTESAIMDGIAIQVRSTMQKAKQIASSQASVDSDSVELVVYGGDAKIVCELADGIFKKINSRPDLTLLGAYWLVT